MRVDRIIISAARAYGVDPNVLRDTSVRFLSGSNVGLARTASVAYLRLRRHMSFTEASMIVGYKSHTSARLKWLTFCNMSNEEQETMIVRVGTALKEMDRDV